MKPWKKTLVGFRKIQTKVVFRTLNDEERDKQSTSKTKISSSIAHDISMNIFNSTVLQPVASNLKGNEVGVFTSKKKRPTRSESQK